MIYHETRYGILHQGEAMDILRQLPDESVNCCVTSPPYWGLRDYGTAEWEGGDPECDHKVGRFEYTVNEMQAGNKGSAGHQARDICPKCGAIRKDRQLGLERTPKEYVTRMVEIFREVYRVLRKDGTLWLNLGDSYAGSGKAGNSIEYQKRHTQFGTQQRKETLGLPTGIPSGLKTKDLVGIPWRVAFALQADGWYLRQDIIWHKPNPMPESVTDRCTKAHEYVFLMSKSAKYYYDGDAIKEPVSDISLARAKYGWNCDRDSTKNASMGGEGIHTERMGTRFVNPNGRNRRSVWTVTTKPFRGAHFATFPRDLIRPMIQAGCPVDGVVLDPFMGSGTTAIEAIYQEKQYIGIDLNPEYCQMAANRIDKELDQMTIFMEEK